MKREREIIRKAKLTEAGFLAKLESEAIQNIGYKKYSPKQIQTWKNYYSKEKFEDFIRKTEVFVIIEKENILGTITLHKNEVHGLYVRHNKKRRGIGSKLMRFIEDYARKKRIKKLTLTSTAAAIKFYERLGYIPKGKIKTKLGGCVFTETKLEKSLK